MPHDAPTDGMREERLRTERNITDQTSVFERYTQRVTTCVGDNKHPWSHPRDICGVELKKVQYLYAELKDGTAGMYNYMLHDGARLRDPERVYSIYSEAMEMRTMINADRSTQQTRAKQMALALWNMRFPTMSHLRLMSAEGRLSEVRGFTRYITELWKLLEELGAKELIQEIMHYQNYAIRRAGPLAEMMVCPFNHQVPNLMSTDADQYIEKWLSVGFDRYDGRRCRRNYRQETLEGTTITPSEFYELRVPENGSHWWPTSKELHDELLQLAPAIDRFGHLHEVKPIQPPAQIQRHPAAPTSPVSPIVQSSPSPPPTETTTSTASTGQPEETIAEHGDPAPVADVIDHVTTPPPSPDTTSKYQHPPSTVSLQIPTPDLIPKPHRSVANRLKEKLSIVPKKRSHKTIDRSVSLRLQSQVPPKSFEVMLSETKHQYEEERRFEELLNADLATMNPLRSSHSPVMFNYNVQHEEQHLVSPEPTKEDPGPSSDVEPSATTSVETGSAVDPDADKIDDIVKKLTLKDLKCLEMVKQLLNDDGSFYNKCEESLALKIESANGKFDK